MIVVKNKDALQQAKNELSGTFGFVPTMGALHKGHLSLMRLARTHADHVIVSIYVNPTQFAPHEDFDTYPRDIEADLMKLESLADIVYLPQTDELYPDGAQADLNTDDFGDAGQGLDTVFRPHFFHGVASVVSRLFDAVQPDVAVFGEKDYQQLMVIREMVAHQKRAIEIIGGPIARDDHGLALSSRNAYLSEGELEIARMLNQVIYNAAAKLSSSRRKPESSSTDQKDPGLRRDDTPVITSDDILGDAREMLLKSGFDKVDYVEQRWGRVLAAAWLGKTRLIDNCTS